MMGACSSEGVRGQHRPLKPSDEHTSVIPAGWTWRHAVGRDRHAHAHASLITPRHVHAHARLLSSVQVLKQHLLRVSLVCVLFSHPPQFKDWFSNPLTGAVETGQEVSKQLVERLHGVLRPFLLR